MPHSRLIIFTHGNNGLIHSLSPKNKLFTIRTLLLVFVECDVKTCYLRVVCQNIFSSLQTDFFGRFISSQRKQIENNPISTTKSNMFRTTTVFSLSKKQFTSMYKKKRFHLINLFFNSRLRIDNVRRLTLINHN